jgi:arylsulfatase A-like enzyme
LEYGNPFASDPIPEWIDEQAIDRNWSLAGPHSAQEVLGFEPIERYQSYSRQPQVIRSLEDARAMFDGYDVGIRYADEHIGRIMSELSRLGIEDETAIMISSDHGETLGELGIYCDHQTADFFTHRVPMILCWPGLDGQRVDSGLRYQIDVTATVAELLGTTIPDDWDGRSFAHELAGSPSGGREHLVLSCAAWATQRSVRFDNWLYIRTYHDAFHDFPPTMLYDLDADPHQQYDVAANRPDVVGQAAGILLDWEADNMLRSSAGVDPIWTVIAEGGGYYTRDRLDAYVDRLVKTGRADQAKRILTGRYTG